MKKGTPEQIEAESKYVIKAIEDADLRCMLGPNCWDTKGTPFVNRDAIVYAARKFGHY